MKPSQIPTALRELANRFEQLAFDDGEPTANVRLNIHHVNTRGDLAKLLALIPNPRLNSEVPCISGYTDAGCEVTLFYEPGLLGGERKEVVIDSEAGLAALMAEYPAGVCEACQGDGVVEDRSGNFPDRPGVNAGPFVEKMECPVCSGDGSEAGR